MAGYDTSDKTADNNGYLPFPKGFSTAAIHAFQEPEKWDSMAVVTPLVTATTFQLLDIQKMKVNKHDYYYFLVIPIYCL